MTSEAWQRFSAYRNSSTGILRTILLSPNPEVALTLPDLLAAALEADNEAIDADTVALVRQGRTRPLSDEEITEASRGFEARFNAPEREPLNQARRARRDFITVLDAFLGSAHYDDGQEGNSHRRDALRRELDWLGENDVVITTNWDTSIERTLFEQGRWTPADGYGFSVDLIKGEHVRAFGQHLPVADWVPQRSQVRVLKLHGSYGWRTGDRYGPRVVEQGSIWLDYDQFLSVMPARRGSDYEFLRDAKAPESYDASAKTPYVIPSYLKQLGGVGVQRIWSEASAALAEASEIRILGAGLPPSDVGVRVLLNPIRARLKAGATRVEVHDPDRKTQERWRQFLGDPVVGRTRRAGEVGGTQGGT